MSFLDFGAGAMVGGGRGGLRVRGEFTGFLDDETGISADFLEEELEGAGGERDAQTLRLSESDACQGLAGVVAVAAREREVGVFFAPLWKRSAAIHG